MAILKGYDDNFRGKLNGCTIYDLNGQVVKRSNGVRVKPFSDLQKANQKVLADMTAVLKPVKEFLEVGFENAGKAARQSAYNTAYSVNYHQAFTGEHPDKIIDFKKLLFSKGKMPETEDLFAERVEKGILFTWNPALTSAIFKTSDQAMFMVYFPQRQFGIYQLSGARRTQGKELLMLPESNRPLVAATYISFISANHKAISDSKYVGQFIWQSI